MKKENYLKTSWYLRIAKPASIVTLLVYLFSSYNVSAQENNTLTEKKVDYLERIYFSGENREGLNTKILIALQELQEKVPTAALTKQMTFLLDIKDKITDADNACDILDLIAAGIYNIDAAEAARQGVKTPSDKAKAKSKPVVDPLASLNKLGSTSNDLSSTARDLQASSILLGGSKAGGIISGAGKVANTAGAVGAVAGTAGQAGQTAKQVGEIGKSLGINIKKKDKPCNDVAKKDIPIGEHVALNAGPINAAANTVNPVSSNTATSTTVINIPGISSSSLRTLTDTLRSRTGVQSAEKSYNESLSIITVVHSGSTDALADWIEDKFSSKFKLVDYANGKINLAAKK